MSGSHYEHRLLTRFLVLAAPEQASGLGSSLVRMMAKYPSSKMHNALFTIDRPISISVAIKIFNRNHDRDQKTKEVAT